MKTQPLSKIIYTKAKKIGVERIILKLHAGHESYQFTKPPDIKPEDIHLDIELIGTDGYHLMSPDDDTDEIKYDEFEKEIRDWAWSVWDIQDYNYRNVLDYGYTIDYNLKTKKVGTTEWDYVIREKNKDGIKLKLYNPIQKKEKNIIEFETYKL